MPDNQLREAKLEKALLINTILETEEEKVIDYYHLGKLEIAIKKLELQIVRQTINTLEN
jgi:hypothetical protein